MAPGAVIPYYAGGGVSIRDRVRSLVNQGRLRVEPLLPYMERSHGVFFRHRVSRRVSRDVLWAPPSGRRSLLISSLALECLGIPLYKWLMWPGERKSGPAESHTPTTQLRILGAINLLQHSHQLCAQYRCVHTFIVIVRQCEWPLTQEYLIIHIIWTGSVTFIATGIVSF